MNYLTTAQRLALSRMAENFIECAIVACALYLFGLLVWKAILS